MQQKKVLIIEPHPYHNEVLPGFVKYFQDLNYQVDVMLREEVYKEKVFCKYKNKPNILPYELFKIKELLSKDSIKEYDFLFCSSLEFLHKNPSDSKSNVKGKFVDFLGFIPKTKFGMLGVYHTIDFIKQFDDYNLLNDGRIFTLTGYAFDNKKTLLLNPHFFGDAKIKQKLNKKNKVYHSRNAQRQGTD